MGADEHRIRRGAEDDVIDSRRAAGVDDSETHLALDDVAIGGTKALVRAREVRRAIRATMVFAFSLSPISRSRAMYN